jgi:hypothetical protein
MGINGIKVNKKIIPGNNAKKKEKLMLAARLVTDPSQIPFLKKIATSRTLRPCKNGTFIFFK